MVKEKNSLPENQSSDPKKGPEQDNNLPDVKEAKKHIEQQAKIGLNSLKEKLGKGEGASEILERSDWLGNNEKTEHAESKKSHEKQTPFGVPVETDHLTYFSRTAPTRRIGEKPLSDVADFSVGVVDSVATTAQLAGHVVIDALKFVRHPIQEIQRTRDMLG